VRRTGAGTVVVKGNAVTPTGAANNGLAAMLTSVGGGGGRGDLPPAVPVGGGGGGGAGPRALPRALELPRALLAGVSSSSSKSVTGTQSGMPVQKTYSSPVNSKFARRSCKSSKDKGPCANTYMNERVRENY
jgi:hypothetical protein